MSTFKLKPPKIRDSVNMETLDKLHKDVVNDFKEKKQNLPLMKKKLCSLQQKYNLLESKQSKNYTTNDIKEKSKLRNKIDDLKDEIIDIEAGVSELEYYSKTDDILMDYYDKLYNGDDNDQNNKNQNDNDQIDNKINTNDTNIMTVFTNEIIKKKNKQNETNNKKKKIASGKMDIRSFFIKCDKIQNNNNMSIKSDESSRAKHLENYKLIMGIKSNNKHTNNIIKYCDTCNNEKVLFPLEGTYVCELCGEIEPLMTDCEKQNYKENMTEKIGYPYKRINHFNEWLSQFQAKESTEIPKEVYDQIHAELHKYKIYDLKTLSVPYMKFKFMKDILKKLNLQSYYEHTTHIICKLSGISPPTINKDTEEKLRFMFRQIQKPFEKHCPKDRLNFLSYSYVLHKFCQLLELDKFIICFPLLKSREKLRAQDKIWEGICKDLKWQFISSI